MTTNSSLDNFQEKLLLMDKIWLWWLTIWLMVCFMFASWKLYDLYCVTLR